MMDLTEAKLGEAGKLETERADLPAAPVRDLATVTVEIQTIHRQAKQMILSYAVEIGRRLVEAKALVGHGEWGGYVRERLGYSMSTANNLMRIYEGYGADQGSLFGAEVNCQTFGNLTYSKALALLAVPEEDREEFVTSHDVEGMSTRELEQAIRERDDAREGLEAERTVSADLRAQLDAAANAAVTAEEQLRNAQREAEDATRAMEAAQRELEELKARPVPVEQPDPAEVDKLVNARLKKATANHVKRMEDLEAKLAEATKRAEDAQKALDEAKANAAAERTREDGQAQGEIAALKRKLAMAAPEVAQFNVHYEAAQREIRAMADAVAELTAAGYEKADGLKQALQALAAWITEQVEA